MKKQVSLSLDADAVAEIKEWLVVNRPNISFSGYIDLIMKEQLAAVRLVGKSEDVSKLPFGEVVGLFFRMLKGMSSKP
jgi:hypothetical protein